MLEIDLANEFPEKLAFVTDSFRTCCSYKVPSGSMSAFGRQFHAFELPLWVADSTGRCNTLTTA